jgi:hypothetical protein
MPIEVKLHSWSEDDALARIISELRNPTRCDPVSTPDYGFDLYLPRLLYHILDEQRRSTPQHQGAGSYLMNTRHNSANFYAAAWNLCLRGVLTPGPIHPIPHGSGGIPTDIVVGGGFNLTAFGREWVQEASGSECVPAEYGRFAQMLASHAARFGEGYHSRSQEAARCYQAHAYYGCCAMCGAAAESVLIALAVAKTGDEERVLRDYNTASGRSKLERLLTGQRSEQVRQSFTTYADLIKYWRDSAAHGASVVIGEEEAFTALMILLRLAQFADSRWEELSGHE